MSHGIAVRSLDSAGGAQLNGGQGFVKVDGQTVVLLGDPVEGHGTGEHAGPVMVEASPLLRINGTPACRQGNAASCGHLSTGRAWFRIP